MASKKDHRNGTPATKPFATSAREAYLLAHHINDAGEYFNRELQVLCAAMESAPSGEEKTVAEEQLDRLNAAREHFEKKLLVDPQGAVNDLEKIQGEMLDVRRVYVGVLLDAAESAAVRRAVNHVYEWIRRTARGEHRGFSMPVATLGPLASARPVASEDDLKRLLASEPVQEALKGDGDKKRGGPKAAAIELVARAMGIGAQTVKRAATGSKGASD